MFNPNVMVRLVLLMITPFFVATIGLAQGRNSSSTTFVTQYVTHVQQERESTRFTLTEWLRIKERMKLMDVYLAMFSNPKKDEFAPEFQISYAASQGSLSFSRTSGANPDGEEVSESSRDQASVKGDEGRVQFWLTNLVTSTLGVQTVNIDLGLEGYQRSSGEFSPTDTQPAAETAFRAANDANAEMDGTRRTLTRFGALNFRLFGKHVQDTQLVIKAGRFEHSNSLEVDVSPMAWRGLMAGAELQMYLLRWLGAEGALHQFGSARSPKGDSNFMGTSANWGAFLEVSLLRFSLGRYSETWRYLDRDGNQREVLDEGVVAGAKLSF